MNDRLSIAWAGLTGIALGAMFFGGLWWTVRKAIALRHPAPWFLGSSLLRTCLAVIGFYFVGANHWQRLVVCLLGFVSVRLLTPMLARPPAMSPASLSPEADHAP